VNRRIDVTLFFERFVPCGPSVFAAPPRTTCDRLDCHYRHITIATHREHAFECSGIVRMLHHDIAVGQQDTIEVETLQAPQMVAAIEGFDGGDHAVNRTDELARAVLPRRDFLKRQD
jgi:hypothetical protein